MKYCTCIYLKILSTVNNIWGRECLALYRAVQNDCVKSKGFPLDNVAFPCMLLLVINHLPTGKHVHNIIDILETS